MFGLVSARYRETKRHYALYNTLLDVEMYLNKELSLLSSILDAYPEYVTNNLFLENFLWTFSCYRVEKSSEAKEQFLRQLETFDVGVKQTLDRVSIVNCSIVFYIFWYDWNCYVFRWWVKKTKSKVLKPIWTTNYPLACQHIDNI